MKNQRGLGLIGILIIIGALIIAAGGVVVWREKTSQTPTSTPLPTKKTASSSSSQSILSPSDIVSKKDTLIGKKILVRGYARRATGPCTGVYILDCNHCPGSIVLSTTPKGKLKSLDAIYGSHHPTEEYNKAIWLLKESQNLLSFKCIGVGLKPNCTYQCPGWELRGFYQVEGIWQQDEWGRYFFEVISKEKL